jgi:hypothetical protein
MQTNQLMQVRIGDHVLGIEHKTMIGSLTEVWKIGNAYRKMRGLPELDLSHWMRSPDTLEYVKVVEKDLGFEYADSAHYEVNKSVLNHAIISPLIKTKRGKGGGTWAHLYILLDAAARLDPNFKHQMYKTFVESRILQWREDSGDEFINLNIAIDAYLPEREGKGNKGVFIQIAKQLKEKILNDQEVWNTASFTQLERRAKIERNLCDLLRLGVVKNYEHLKELITKL